MRIDLVNSVAAKVNGYQALRPAKGYDYESVRQRLIFEKLTQGVQYVFNNAVEGDIAEFGTATGFSARTISIAMSVYRQMYRGFMEKHGIGQKNLYLFDSFQGLPRPHSSLDLESPNVASGRWQEGTFQGLNKEELLALCSSAYDADKISIIEGWYSSSLDKIPTETKFAMVHLDCDLYSSTIEVLDYLFSRAHISDGCCLFFDDWNCNRSSPRFGQRRAWREAVEKYKIDYSDGGDYAIIGHKFTVHLGC